jgi:hypothetical protein
VFVSGDPGDAVNLQIQVPYPFVTNGAVPIHAYSTFDIASNGMGGFCTQPGTDVTSTFNISTAGGNRSSSGAPVILKSDYSPQQFGTNTTVTVAGQIPSSGWTYVTIHLEYGLRGSEPWYKAGETACSANVSSPPCPASASNTSIPEPRTYTFSYSGTVDSGSVGHTQTTQSINEFKKPAGFMGFVTSASTGDPVKSVKVQIYSPTNALLGTVYTDEDGYYLYPYKHKSASATYTVKLPDKAKQQSVTVKANGYAVVDFAV